VGSLEHLEQIVYHIEDAHPEHATTFYYAASRSSLRDGVMLRTRSGQEDIPRELQ